MEKRSLDRSKALYDRACRVIPGGVNSPVRAFRAVGSSPVFIRRGEGPYIYDEDGNRYIDYVGSWGPLVLGHAHPSVVEAIEAAARRGSSFGAPTELECELAEEVAGLVPSIEKVRMTSSGTEAVMSAVRLARGFTKREIVIKFAGCYHGHVDGLLVAQGSGGATFGHPTTPGVPEGYARNTVVVPYNDLEATREAAGDHGDNVACIIVEPIAGNMGVVPPVEGFLEGLRELCDAADALLIFDEVITGFRVSPGGAQELFGIRPDLTTLGKIVGGGLPVGAFGGRAEIMDQLSPDGPIYQAGTLSGNPLAMAAGLATLRELLRDGNYERLSHLGEMLGRGIEEVIGPSGVEATTTCVGSMMSVFFTHGPIRNFEDVSRCDTTVFAGYFNALLARGIYIAPSQFEAVFVSLSHTEEIVQQTVQCVREALEEVAGG